MPAIFAKSGKPKAGRRTLWVRGLLCAFLLVSMAACNSEPPPSPKAKAFIEQMQGIFERFNPELASYAAKGDCKGAQAQMKKDYQAAVAKGSKLRLVAAVLDSQGRLLASYSPFSEADNVIAGPDMQQNYGGYDLVKQVINDDDISNGSLHFGNEEFYVICGPLTEKGKLVGVLVLAFEEKDLIKAYDITRDEFMSLDFN